jgi:hypothetical protein
VGGLLILGIAGPFGPYAPTIFVDVAEGESTVELPSGFERPMEAIAFARVGEGKTALRAIYRGARDALPPGAPSPDDLPLPHRFPVDESTQRSLTAGSTTWAVFFSDSAGQVEVTYHLKAAAAPEPAAP